MKNKIFTIPNILSFFRICLIPVFIWLYCVKKDYIGTGVILVVSGVTDMADGFIARHFNMVSDLGKILDPIADKLTQGVVLFCLLTRFSLMLVPLSLLIVKEIFMGITGWLIIKNTGKVYGADWHGKVATILLDAMMVMHVIWYAIPENVSNLSIICCTVMMFVSLILYGMRNLKVLRKK